MYSFGKHFKGYNPNVLMPQRLPSYYFSTVLCYCRPTTKLHLVIFDYNQYGVPLKNHGIPAYTSTINVNCSLPEN